jgi:outer membrane lipoprotein carrier protein
VNPRRSAIVAIGFAVAAAAGAADGGGIDELTAFVEGARNGRATFRQTVTARNARGEQVSTGSFAFARPGKFRWSYEKPYEQLVVGDGEKVWVYDRDLNQVIVRPLDAALGATPAALLAGDNALERNFTLVDGGGADGLAWVEATPRSSDSTFSRVRIGFRDRLPRAMELVDAFGQTTRLTFDRFERNLSLPAELFRFSPPPGADVVSAPGAR